MRQWVHQSLPTELVRVVDQRLLLHDAAFSTGDWNGFLVAVFELGLLCSADSAVERTGMRDVVVKLKNIRKDYIKLTATTTRKNDGSTSVLSGSQ